MGSKLRVMITGANGFLGQSILSSLSDGYQIKALCRSTPKQENQKILKNIEWIQCDLFNLKQTEEALQNVDVLLYLVHSMTKGNRFSQSRFEDLDLIIADNVARAAKKNHLKQIIFITGIIPDEVKSLSKHLKSRQEVETVLGLSGIPTTCIRSGIIIGAGGSSFQIVYRLVKKLKVMATPKWTQSKSQPIDVRDVVTLALKAVGNTDFFNQKIDVHGSETLSYNDLMKKFASIMNVKRLFVHIPFFNLSISKLWLQLISGMDYDLVSPLVDSLKHDLPAKRSELFEKYIPNPIPLPKSIQYWIAIEEKRAHRQKSKQEFEKEVRSVQRLSLPKGWNAVDLAKEYVNWLPRMFVSGNMIHFDLFGLKLLSLLLSEDRSTPDRQLFYIVGGLLVSPNLSGNARLEFRMCPHENSALVAIHDYRPSLPWYLYRLFQANIHSFVMFLFGRHLEKVILLTRT